VNFFYIFPGAALPATSLQHCKAEQNKIDFATHTKEQFGIIQLRVIIIVMKKRRIMSAEKLFISHIPFCTINLTSYCAFTVFQLTKFNNKNFITAQGKIVEKRFYINSNVILHHSHDSF
jgi:hypothetical protein